MSLSSISVVTSRRLPNALPRRERSVRSSSGLVWLLVLLAPALIVSPGRASAAVAATPWFEPVHTSAGRTSAYRGYAFDYSVAIDAEGQVYLALGEERLRLRVVRRAAEASLEPTTRRQGHSHHVHGDDPRQWRSNVPHYGEIVDRGVLAGIDARYYASAGRLGVDFLVSPHGRPGRLELLIEGADAVTIDGTGQLCLELGDRMLSFSAPVSWQTTHDGSRRPRSSRFVRRGPHAVGFAIDDYDPALPLVIDPVLSFSSLLGGVGADVGQDVAFGPGGDTYVVGQTQSPDFPLQGALDGALTGNAADAFVARIDTDGQLVYATFLGGSGEDRAYAVHVDDNGIATIGGETSSADFPTASALRTALAGSSDGFVARLAADGTALQWSTLLGGDGADAVRGVTATSTGGVVYAAGETTSTDFPITPNATQGARGGAQDAFVVELFGGNSLSFATYLGGSADDAASAIAIAGDGFALFVAGTTESADFPVSVGALRGSNPTAPNDDGFVTAWDAVAIPAGYAYRYSTYLGGAAFDRLAAIDADAALNVYVAGQSTSSDYPVLNAFQFSPLAAPEAIVTHLDGNGALVYSTYLGASGGSSVATGIAVDPAGRAWITGGTAAADFPVTDDRTQPDFGGGEDAFVSRLSTVGDILEFSTALGGPGNDTGLAITIDPVAPGVAVTGVTDSGSSFPLVDGLDVSAPPTVDAAFVATITDDAPAAPAGNLQFDPIEVSVLENAGFVELTVTRTGGSSGAVGASYETVSGSALLGEDFAGQFASVTFADGETTAQTIRLDLFDNGERDGEKRFTVELFGPTGGATLGADDLATVVLLDDEFALVGLEPLDLEVAEGEGVATLSVQLSDVSDEPINVTYETRNGTAAAGVDYEATAGTLVLAPGEQTATIDVQLLDNDCADGARSFLLDLTEVSGESVLDPARATATVRVQDDDDAGGLVQWAWPSVAIEEGDLSPERPFLLRSAGSQGELTVSYVVEDRSARADADYRLTDGEITFADGEFAKSISLDVVNDFIDEPSEFLIVRLLPPQGDTQLGLFDELLVEIRDFAEDQAPAQAGLDEVLRMQVREGETVSLGVVASPDGGDVYELNTLSLGGAEALTDYAPLMETLSLMGAEEQRTLEIAIADDGEAEPFELFWVTLDDFNGRAQRSQVQIGIIDAAASRASVLSASAGMPNSVVEGERATITISRTDGRGTATVDYIVAPITVEELAGLGTQNTGVAAAGSDFLTSTGTVSFGEGQTQATFEVTTQRDGLTEGLEAVAIWLTNASGAAAFESPGGLFDLLFIDDPPRDQDHEGCTGDDCCFIATAAYGSYLEPQVMDLRRFRDRVLRKTALGRRMVELYYRYSPPVAAVIARHEGLRRVTRWALTPVVVAVAHPAMTGLVFSVFGVGTVIAWRRRRPRAMASG